MKNQGSQYQPLDKLFSKILAKSKSTFFTIIFIVDDGRYFSNFFVVKQ